MQERILRVPASDKPAPFTHWMLREIYEQPASLAATLERYTEQGRLRTETCAPIFEWLRQINGKILIAASGSSGHAGLVAEPVIEDLSGIAVDVEYASEYCYRSERALACTGILVVSQSGETADTLAALRKATLVGHATCAITNVADSTMAREATVSFPTVAGRERAIPATKSFTAQLLNLYLLALMGAVSRGTLTDSTLEDRLAEASHLPALLEAQLAGWDETIQRIAGAHRTVKNFLFLGRGLHFPIAREGALKLKESAYLPTQAYPCGELKHGPNALVTDRTPLVILATVDRAEPDSLQRYEKTVQLMRDMRLQGASVIAVANTGDENVRRLADHTIFVQQMREPLLAICEVTPLQMLAYYMAIHNGINVDRPRNLTKAVLAE